MKPKTMSQLQKIIKQAQGTSGTTAYVPKGGDETDFMNKHEIQVTDDANGNGDEVFKGKIVKKINRAQERHGYDSPVDQRVHEEIDYIEEMSKRMKDKRHEISLALKRENPSWPLNKVFAIATASAKKAVQEEFSESINPKNPRDYNKPAYLRKKAGEAPLKLKDVEDRDDESPTTSKGLAKRKKEMGMEESLDVRLLELFAQLDDKNKEIMLEMINDGLEDTILEFLEEHVNG